MATGLQFLQQQQFAPLAGRQFENGLIDGAKLTLHSSNQNDSWVLLLLGARFSPQPPLVRAHQG